MSKKENMKSRKMYFSQEYNKFKNIPITRGRIIINEQISNCFFELSQIYLFLFRSVKKIKTVGKKTLKLNTLFIKL